MVDWLYNLILFPTALGVFLMFQIPLVAMPNPETSQKIEYIPYLILVESIALTFSIWLIVSCWR